MKIIKPIETTYKGYRFRSRLEARWAVFFDGLFEPWEYELEGYDLGDGLQYLPDFYLPHQQCWVEVKPEWPGDNSQEAEKAKRLSEVLCKWVDVLCGTPGEHEIIGFRAGKLERAFFMGVCESCGSLGFGSQILDLIGIDPFDGWRGHCYNCHGSIRPDKRIQQATEVARSARFEHQEG